MSRTIKFILLLIGFSFALNADAQLKQKPTWKISINPLNPSVGDEVELVLKSPIEKDWYMYSNDFSEDVGPVVALIQFAKNDAIQCIGKPKPKGNHKKFDEVFGGEVSTFTKEAVFVQKIKILKENPTIKVSLDFQECSQVTGMCVLFEDELKLRVQTKNDGKNIIQKTESAAIPEPPIDTNNNAKAEIEEVVPESATETKPQTSTEKGLFSFLIFALLGGLVAVLTPCVFPMLPMTVTFFTKKSDTKALAIKRALGFGLSIILIYSSLGLLFSLLGLGPDFGNWLSTSWLPNILFFIIFIVFAASFLGLFEITLPHGFVNQIDSKSNMASFAGVFFMAFTLVLVSFSCTGPIVGSLLIEAVGGAISNPLLGMAAFGACLALPFTLFAIFPSWIQGLPKSGGWLNSVKVVLGFLELALAFKFLSIPDQTYHWGLLDRDVYLAIWIAIFSLMGLYLIGKLRLSHDAENPAIGVPRLFLAIASFTFVIYLIPGMWGAPLKGLSGYLPPIETLDFKAGSGEGVPQNEAGKNTSDKGTKYQDIFKLPHGINGFFDYKEALAYSKKVNKPIFIDFTGHGCVNCREMEANVWSNPEVLNLLKTKFVVLALYVDDKTELPENEWYVSKYDGKEKKTIGKQNFDLQITKFNANAQPYYVIMDANEKVLTQPRAYDLDINKFISFLNDGIKNFN
jgi:thiol:disulfide interchange protein DsbD